MKRINFLVNLCQEEKIKIIDTSEEIKESYIKKSDNSLKSAEILLHNDQIEDAIPLAYYSMYHILTALFYKVGIKCENHSASIIILKELFGIDNSLISLAKTERIDKQYYVDFEITKEEVREMIDSAKEFNANIYDFIEKSTTKRLSDYQEELKRNLS